MENSPPATPLSPTSSDKSTPSEPPIVNPVSKKPKNKLVPLLVFLLLAALTIAGYFGWQNLQLQQQIKNQIVPTPQVNNQPPSPTPTTIDEKPYTENTNITNQKNYINPQLGISFLYLSVDPLDNTATFNTKEVNNKVYLYHQNSPYETGQYIEIFQKDPNLNLEEAIQNNFLTNYSKDKCYIENINSTSYPSAYSVASIRYVHEDTSIALQDSINPKDCPQTYTPIGGSAFFLMDKNQPDKFVFFSIGQYGIFANEDNTMWETTIKFLD